MVLDRSIVATRADEKLRRYCEHGMRACGDRT
jgi:hypothetical protein